MLPYHPWRSLANVSDRSRPVVAAKTFGAYRLSTYPRSNSMTTSGLVA